MGVLKKKQNIDQTQSESHIKDTQVNYLYNVNRSLPSQIPFFHICNFKNAIQGSRLKFCYFLFNPRFRMLIAIYCN